MRPRVRSDFGVDFAGLLLVSIKPRASPQARACAIRPSSRAGGRARFHETDMQSPYRLDKFQAPGVCK